MRYFRYFKKVLYVVLALLILRWIILPILCELGIRFLYIFILQNCKNGDLPWTWMTFRYSDDGIKEVVLNCIPSVPYKYSPIAWHVPVLDPALSEEYLRLPEYVNYSDRVIILTPIRDASKHLSHFSMELSKLNYPHHLISVYFGEDGSSDDTVEVAQQMSDMLKQKYGFRDANVFKLSVSGNNSTRKTRHFGSKQIERRSHLARSRNVLTKLALDDEAWVLWIDVDVYIFPPDIIQQFLYSDKDVMVASALVFKVELGYLKTYGVYDRNSRRIHNENNGSKQHNIYVNDLKGEGREAKIDLVGACALMIRADCLRKGLVFPEEPFIPNGVMVKYEGLESEGLGQLAAHMGFRVYGLPYLEVYHVYEPDKKENIIYNFFYTIYCML